MKTIYPQPCSCDNGIIICPGCDGHRESYFGICAGCKGSGIRICGKCGGGGGGGGVYKIYSYGRFFK